MSTPSLEKVFELQNKVILKYIQDNLDLYEFVSFCFRTLDAADLDQHDWQKLSLNQRTIFNLFEGDITSTLINATRLCLQGCETDSYALMRVVLEELTVFQYISMFSKFDEVFTEIQEKLPKARKFGDNFRYKKVIRKLKKDDREKVYGLLSNIGTHLSPQRLALSRRRDGKRERLKVGMMLANPNTAIALGQLARLYLFSIDVFNDFFIKFLDNPSKSPFTDSLTIAKAKYKNLAEENHAPQ